MSNSLNLVGVKQRLEQLANAGETLLGYAPVSDTNEGVYFVTLRHYPHPDDDGVSVLNCRYAYLTKGEGSDGWLDNGINLRCEGDPNRMLAGLARLFYDAGDVLEGDDDDPVGLDLRPREEN